MSVFLCSPFLPQPCLPHLIQHSRFAPSHTAVVTSSKMPPTCRCSLQLVLSSLIQLLAPKQLCSIPIIKLAGSMGSHVLLSPLLTSCYFFQESHKSKTALLLFALHRSAIADTISSHSPPNFFPGCHQTILLLFSPVLFLFTPHKTTAIL